MFLSMKKIIFSLFLLAIGIAALAQILIKNTDELKHIQYIREEEKLARDVYEALYAKWGVNPFGNIRLSEQTHMDKMKWLIDKYNLADPIKLTKDEKGKFENQQLQELYYSLIKDGNKSLVDALKVGATIEELDIKDIQDAMKQTHDSAILQVYENLVWASENHLNAFVSQLNRKGVTYTPTILSKSQFDNIIKNDHRGGKHGGEGRGNGGNCNEQCH